MPDRLLSRLRLDPGMAACWWRTFFPSLALLLLTAAFIVTKTGRDAMYFQRDGLPELPKAYLLIAILSAPAALGTLGLMRLCGPRGARTASLLLMAVWQAAFYALHPRSGGGMTLFFVLVPLLYGVALSVTWLLGADLLDSAPRFVHARLYSTMGAASMTGGLMGAALARTFAGRLAPEAYLLLGAALLTATAVVAALAHRTFPVDTQAVSPGVMPVPNGGDLPNPAEVLGLLRNRYTLLLSAVGVVASITGVLIEFQFYSAASTTAVSERDKLALFSNFYIVLNGAALLLQVVGAPPLQRAFGVYGSLLILPVSLLGASLAAAASASTLARAWLRVVEGGLKSSIHRVNWEQAYLPLDRSRRAFAKILVDGVAARFGEGTAAGILLAASGSAWIGAVLIAGTALWVVLTVALRRSRQSPDLLPEGELRPDLPIPDGCITVGTLGEGVQRRKLTGYSG